MSKIVIAIIDSKMLLSNVKFRPLIELLHALLGKMNKHFAMENLHVIPMKTLLEMNLKRMNSVVF